MARQQRYLSYLLRLWQTSDGDEQVWRASLESPGSGERRGFASLQELFGFLDDEAGSGCKRNPSEEDHRTARGDSDELQT